MAVLKFATRASQSAAAAGAARASRAGTDVNSRRQIEDIPRSSPNLTVKGSSPGILAPTVAEVFFVVKMTDQDPTAGPALRRVHGESPIGKCRFSYGAGLSEKGKSAQYV